MTATAATPARAINLRLHDETRALIDRAAQVRGKSRSEFMIEAARRAAEEALLDQTLVRVDAETYGRFVRVLDRPPASKGFERLMNAPRPWEK
jgi:uncharacterized protein (DUF1778 family)